MLAANREYAEDRQGMSKVLCLERRSECDWQKEQFFSNKNIVTLGANPRCLISTWELTKTYRYGALFSVRFDYHLWGRIELAYFSIRWAFRTSLAVKAAMKGAPADDGFDGGSAALFAVDEAEDCGDVHAGFAGGFDGGDGGAAGGADVVDDDDVGSGFEEAFDAAAGAVGLFGFADEEAVDEGGGGFGNFVAEFERRGRVR